jgi:FtsZ-interacting cell division protein ZipA
MIVVLYAVITVLAGMVACLGLVVRAMWLDRIEQGRTYSGRQR